MAVIYNPLLVALIALNLTGFTSRYNIGGCLIAHNFTALDLFALIATESQLTRRLANCLQLGKDSVPTSYGFRTEQLGAIVTRKGARIALLEGAIPRARRIQPVN